MKYQVYSQSGEKVKEVDLNPAIFEVEANEGLIHQVVVAQMSNARQVLSHAKDRSEVKGGGRKPWRQKGTGRARHGSIRSPLWKGGGVTFGPTKERNFSKKINKKMKKKALFMCISDRANDHSLVLLDKLEIKENKTKEVVKTIESLKDILKLKEPSKKTPKTKDTKDAKAKKTDTKKTEEKKEKKFDIKNYKTSILIVTGKNTGKVARVAKNIVGLKVLGANSLNIVDVLKYQNLLMTEDSLEVLAKTYLK